MTKDLIDVDDELVAATQHELQTTGVCVPHNSKLRRCVPVHAHLEWLRAGGLAHG